MGEYATPGSDSRPRPRPWNYCAASPCGTVTWSPLSPLPGPSGKGAAVHVLEPHPRSDRDRPRSRRKGREEGHVGLTRAALQAAYGDLNGLARRLAARDHSANIARIIAGAAPDDLRP